MHVGDGGARMVSFVEDVVSYAEERLEEEQGDYWDAEEGVGVVEQLYATSVPIFFLSFFNETYQIRLFRQPNPSRQPRNQSYKAKQLYKRMNPYISS